MGVPSSKKQPRLSDMIHDRIKDAIESGQIGVHTRLIDSQLAAELEVSRTPVREALLQLCREGLIEEQTQGYTLPLPSADDAKEIVEARRIIDIAVLRLIIESKQPIDCAQLEDAQRAECDAVEADNFQAFLKANAAFRRAVVAICPNKTIRSLADSLTDQVNVFRTIALASRDSQRIVTKLHDDLIQAMKDRDFNASRRLMETLLDMAAKDFRIELEEVERKIRAASERRRILKAV